MPFIIFGFMPNEHAKKLRGASRRMVLGILHPGGSYLPMLITLPFDPYCHRQTPDGGLEEAFTSRPRGSCRNGIAPLRFSGSAGLSSR